MVTEFVLQMNDPSPCMPTDCKRTGASPALLHPCDRSPKLSPLLQAVGNSAGRSVDGLGLVSVLTAPKSRKAAETEQTQ